MANEISLDELHLAQETLARKNGRMEFANEVAKWAVKRRDQLPPNIREELARLIERAGE